MSHIQLDYRIAPLDPSELNLVLSSWKRSYRESCYEDMRTDMFYAAQSAICEALLARWPTILVARSSNGVALGWIAGESTKGALVVHYTYVKAAYRKEGIAKALLVALIDDLPNAGDGQITTHKTRHHPIAQRYGFSYVSVGQFLRDHHAA